MRWGIIFGRVLVQNILLLDVYRKATVSTPCYKHPSIIRTTPGRDEGGAEADSPLVVVRSRSSLVATAPPCVTRSGHVRSGGLQSRGTGCHVEQDTVQSPPNRSHLELNPRSGSSGAWSTQPGPGMSLAAPDRSTGVALIL